MNRLKWREGFRDALGELPEGQEALTWVRASLPKLTRDRANGLVRSMLEAFIEGGFEDATTYEMEGIWDALFEDGYGPRYIVRECETEAAWKRWAWSPRWILFEQDEDIIFLFDAPKRLLALAFGCPKRDYILRCVAHGVRDRALAFVVTGTGPSPFEEAQSLLFDARSAHALELSDYLERLAGYAKTGPVDREGAVQRGHDLHRCDPPRTEDVDVSLQGEVWVVRYTTPGALLHPDLRVHARRA